MSIYLVSTLLGSGEEVVAEADPATALALFETHRTAGRPSILAILGAGGLTALVEFLPAIVR